MFDSCNIQCVNTMTISLDFQKPLRLPRELTDESIETILENIPQSPGIYIFGRMFGTNFHALYVGQANNLRGRIKQQLNNRSLMSYINGARNGRRVILIGLLGGHGNINQEKHLDVAERALLRHYVSVGDDLHNKNGIKVKRHEIRLSGKHPKGVSHLFVER
jgi:hypothetical protein